MAMDKINELRGFMKSNFDESDDFQTDQQKGVKQPPLEKPHDLNGEIIKLPEFDENILCNNNLLKCMGDRRSHRKYKEEKLSLSELSFLLWATQGVQNIRGNNYATFRPVPSGGARHAFETYIFVNNVEDLKKGLYRYLAISHELIFIKDEDNSGELVTNTVVGQSFVSKSAVVFYWSCVPYRGEWRYSTASHKVMLLDAGHICQNLYLACEAIGCGTCAIGAYDQIKTDKFLGIDGIDEYTVYIAPVGRV